jgi:cytochrome c peroxidase
MLRIKKPRGRYASLLAMVCIASNLFLLAPSADAVVQFDDDDNPLSAQVPMPGNLDDFVKDMAAAKRLGKALFWDEQTGSDGQVACATCHFAIGADHRITNTMNPGPNGIFDVVPPGGTLDASDFPIESDDIVGSQGVVRHDFDGINEGSAVDFGTPVVDPLFGSNRRVTGRNTPTNIMSVLNKKNFWDGRANFTFNGVHPGGPDSSAFVHRKNSGGGTDAVNVGLSRSSSASQAVGPPNNEVEMAFGDGATNGRSFPELGKKLLALQPLGLQVVHGNDSVLGSISDGSGLTRSYEQLIMDAFHEEWWDSSDSFDRTGAPSAGGSFSQMEANFSLFWGLAQQVYESELIPNDTPFDRGEMTSSQEEGFDIFTGEGECDECHAAPEFSTAVFTNFDDDEAFVNTGVRPISEDAGVGQGRFKSNTIRNIELTGPYFHNGSKLTLRQVVDFYDRGGDFQSDETEIDDLGLSSSEKNDLVAFMLALTDDRLRISAAPFDHPSLSPPNGDFVSATGAAGGAPTPAFLDADHFDQGGSTPVMLRTDEDSVSLSQGGSQNMTLKDPAHAGRSYMLLGSISGSLPGTDLGGGIWLPLNQDVYYAITFSSPTTTLVNSVGTLDQNGLAMVEFSLPSGLSPNLAGIVGTHAYAVLNNQGQVISVSNAVSVALVP